MRTTTLIVPGLNDSGHNHWQTWLESRVDGAQRVVQRDWSQPALAVWAETITRAIDEAVGQVWIVAHSFGCLATVKAAADRADRVAGALLVAPANPERFSAQGLDPNAGNNAITARIPHRELGFPSIVVASSDDPWMRLTAASVWADRWGSQFDCIGRAGHINADSGFGPWPYGLGLFERFREVHGGEPLGALGALTAPSKRRTSTAPSNGHIGHAERMLERQWFG